MDGESPVVVRRFFKVLVSGFETSLKLPPAFIKTLDNMDLNSESSVLKSCKGLWKVGVKTCSDDGSLHFFGENWETYVKDHDLKVGEFIVFEQVGLLKFNTLVYDETSCLKDFGDLENEEDNVVGLEHVEDGRFLENSSSLKDIDDLENKEDNVVCLEHVEEEIDGGEDVPLGGSKPILNSQFQMTVTSSNFEGYMYIPKAFATTNGISREGGILTLRNATGDSWKTKLHVYTEYKGNRACRDRFCIRRLSKFLKENKLKVGDRCIFELDHSWGNPKHVVMNVLFVRKQ